MKLFMGLDNEVYKTQRISTIVDIINILFFSEVRGL